MKNYVFMKINNPNDALSGVIIQNSGGQLDPNLLQILDPVLLHLLLPRQLCVVHQRVLQLVRTHYRQNISANVRRLSRWLKLREFGSGIISYSLVDGRDIGFGQGGRHLVLVAGSWTSWRLSAPPPPWPQSAAGRTCWPGTGGAATPSPARSRSTPSTGTATTSSTDTT